MMLTIFLVAIGLAGAAAAILAVSRRAANSHAHPAPADISPVPEASVDVPAHIRNRAEPAFEAMQLLGDFHGALDHAAFDMSVAAMVARAKDLNPRLVDNDCPPALVRDLGEHFDLAACALDLWSLSTIEGNVDAADAVTRVVDQLGAQTPVLVGRLGAWLDEPDKADMAH